uniref:Uncharacterized protein n=1 Tax=Astyanax mexicanus TaxID=7994 RepID=A0A3B1KJP1_ASTMX
VVAHTCSPSYFRRLRQENCLNPGAGGCMKQDLCHLHSSLGDRVRPSVSKKKKMPGWTWPHICKS